MFSGRIDGVGHYQVTILHLGTLTIPPGAPMGGRTIPVNAFLVAHPLGQLLFDTGLGDAHDQFDQVLSATRSSLAGAFASLGVRPADVIAIVNCHLHYDHCGGNPAFPGVPIYVQSRDYEAGAALNWCVPDRVDFPGVDLRVLDGEAEILPGVRAVPTPGHTPGHQSLIIDDADGPVILGGQAAYTVEEFADPEAEPARGAKTAWDRGAFLDSISYLKSLRPRRVYLGHDDGFWEP